ncbi:two-component system, NarL family, sensor histidine kinase DesK [Paenibacillus sp. UNC496MF]|uniref:sensor histidine kinase n=1 Tax=Paenibacillus sp. UNC496MF TaxID=1502753 RepID=UPI0008EC9454|nr:sensor histidine kinase [Paenibacillus sp. UNC496MF]SFI75083.1 two-component system, NarL family, sensor histidine kinase DesK [Paenibacillus sp. UNC496MF]
MFKFARRPASGPPLVFTLVWLVYLVFPLTALFQLPAVQMIEGLGVVLVFVALYVGGYFLDRWRIVSVFGLIAITLLFCLKFDASGIYLAFYASPLVGQLRKRWELIAGYILMLGLFGFNIVYWHVYRDPDMMVQLFPAMAVMLLMPIGFKLGQRSKELRKKLNLANEEIARLSKNEERQRISRDLHDTLGHTLSLITLKSELAEKLIMKNPDRAAQEVKDIQMTSRAALKQVRELVSGMNAVTIRQEVDHAKQILAAAGIFLEKRGELAEAAARDDGTVSPEEEAAFAGESPRFGIAPQGSESDAERLSPSPLIDNILGMCLRESVTNVVKHSRARVCTVDLRREPGVLRMTVEDDGVGLPDKGKDETAAGCNGMKGMRDRLKLIEGVLAAERPLAERGTRLVFTVPLVDKAREGA